MISLASILDDAMIILLLKFPSQENENRTFGIKINDKNIRSTHIDPLLFLVIPRSPKTRSQNIATFKPFPS